MNNEQLKVKINLLHQGDRKAFEEIYNELKTPVFTIILRIVGNRELAEDILQEVFVKLYTSPLQPSVLKPRAYLLQMARNLAIDGLRKQKQFINLQDIENIVPTPCDFSQKLYLDDALKTLPLIDCEIVTLHINAELKFREIAEIVELPLGTVLWKYQKALSKLRNILDGGAL